MEIKKFLAKLAVIFALTSCTNTPDLETGEIQTFQMIKNAFEQQKHSKGFVDARTLLSREQINAANIPVLFVELESGQNGTLTPYPGQGIGQTWLGADGATITTDRGILKASRGMGDDLMGSSLSMPTWSKIHTNVTTYLRELKYTSGNNEIIRRSFECNIKKNNYHKVIKIWDAKFAITEFEENCSNNEINIRNFYYLDNQGIVRRSSQYHSENLGYLLIERLDR